MAEWWTYSLADFLMFSPRTYARLLEGYLRETWPALVLGFAAGGALLVLGAMQRPRAVALLLALAWAWVAWGFLWQRLATIHLAAPWYAAAAGVQAALLGLAAASASTHAARGPATWRGLGWGIGVSAVMAYPIVTGWMRGTVWQAEAFGTMPDPTALATLGLLLTPALPWAPAWRVALAVIPALTVAIGWATLRALAQYGSA